MKIIKRGKIWRKIAIFMLQYEQHIQSDLDIMRLKGPKNFRTKSGFDCS
jgi:hypothetical protein